MPSRRFWIAAAVYQYEILSPPKTYTLEIYRYLIFAHVAFGIISFGAGFVASLAAKGSLRHRRAGKVFSISLSSAAIVALMLSSLKPNPFLFAIGWFTLYLIFSGWIWTWRVPLQRKNRGARIIGVCGLAIASYMIYIGIGASRGAQILLSVFGGILLIFAIVDLIKLPKGLKIYSRHGGRLGGAFIASITAFGMTNFLGYLPEMVLWLLPTAIGTPIIILALRKFSAGRS